MEIIVFLKILIDNFQVNESVTFELLEPKTRL